MAAPKECKQNSSFSQGVVVVCTYCDASKQTSTYLLYKIILRSEAIEKRTRIL